MKEVRITYRPDGTTEVEVNGAKGKACEDLTRDLERALGKPSQKRFKREYYNTNAETIKEGK